jgi:hypothetical protein
MPLPFLVRKTTAKPKNDPSDQQAVLKREGSVASAKAKQFSFLHQFPRAKMATDNWQRTPERSGNFAFGERLSTEDFDIE